MRLALFTLESALSAEAVARFLREHGEAVVLIGRSRPFRPAAGGALRQGWRHLRRSGPRLLPYLWANYALPQGLGRLRRLAGGRGTLAGLAAARGLPVHDLDDVNDAATAAALRAARPDLLVSLHFDQIFTAATLALAPLGGINLHPSLLPRHRGPVPAIWALAEPEPAFGVTIHRLVPRIDAGAILAQAAVPLPPGHHRQRRRAGAAPGRGAAAVRGPGRRWRPAPAPGRAGRCCPTAPSRPRRCCAAWRRRGRRLVDAADLRSGLACRIG